MITIFTHTQVELIVKSLNEELLNQLWVPEWSVGTNGWYSHSEFSDIYYLLYLGVHNY